MCAVYWLHPLTRVMAVGQGFVYPHKNERREKKRGTWLGSKSGRDPVSLYLSVGWITPPCRTYVQEWGPHEGRMMLCSQPHDTLSLPPVAPVLGTIHLALLDWMYDSAYCVAVNGPVSHSRPLATLALQRHQPQLAPGARGPYRPNIEMRVPMSLHCQLSWKSDTLRVQEHAMLVHGRRSLLWPHAPIGRMVLCVVPLPFSLPVERSFHCVMSAPFSHSFEGRSTLEGTVY